MISFEDFLMLDTSPIYVQILLYIKRGVVAGTIMDGDELPSRRMLSARLGVNPNTVQKAYRMLEEEGLISSHSGAKSYISLSEEKVEAVRAELMAGMVRTLVDAVRNMGVSREEALALVGKLWDEEVQA